MDVAITPELKREILGWGLEVEVLARASLREKLLATVKQMAARSAQRCRHIAPALIPTEERSVSSADCSLNSTF
jgi:predicted DNA-binding transcriptional regulator YafY